MREREAEMKLDKILVPLDGSRLAEGALRTAVSLAKGSPGAVITLLRAAEASTLPGADPAEAQVRVVREAEGYLESVAAGLKREGIGPVKTSVWYGPPAEAILESAEVTQPDLIVMSTHGRSGLGRLILGSVAESVVRGTRTPIMLLRDGAAPVERAPGAAAARAARETTHV
jgi:nucleotide-binding universal stress UspA family protein